MRAHLVGSWADYDVIFATYTLDCRFAGIFARWFRRKIFI